MTNVAEKLAKKSSSRPASKQVRLKLVYVDFWSAMKLSFLAALAVAIMTVVFFALVYSVLQGLGLIDSVNKLYMDFTEGKQSLNDILGFGRVMGFAAVIAFLNLVVITALGAVAAGLYNLAVKMSGGLLVGFTNQ